MNEALSIISGVVGSILIALVLAGLTIGVMCMVSPTVRADLSRSSVRTTGGTTFRAGSWNLNVRLLTQEENLELLSTRNTAQQSLTNSTPLSHSGCWCNSSRKQDINNAKSS